MGNCHETLWTGGEEATPFRSAQAKEELFRIYVPTADALGKRLGDIVDTGEMWIALLETRKISSRPV